MPVYEPKPLPDILQRGIDRGVSAIRSLPFTPTPVEVPQSEATFGPDTSVLPFRQLNRVASHLASPPGLEFMSPMIFAGPKAMGFAKAEGKFSSMADRMPRFEISDVGPQLNLKKFTKSKYTTSPNTAYFYEGKLGDVYPHNELYKQYPELADTKVRISFDKGPDVGFYKDHRTGEIGKAAGEHNPLTGEIIVHSGLGEENTRATLLHEIQHAVQEKERFVQGGSPASFSHNEAIRLLNKSNDYLRYANDKVIQDMVQASIREDIPLLMELSKKDPEAFKLANQMYLELGTYPTTEVLRKKSTELARMSEKTVPVEQYKKLGGEIESRDVANRMNLTPEQRLHIPPYSSENIPLKDWIIRK